MSALEPGLDEVCRDVLRSYDLPGPVALDEMDARIAEQVALVS